MPITLLPASDTSERPRAAASLPESRVDRLLKLLPSEVLLFYPAVISLCGSPPLRHLTATFLGLIAVIWSLHHDARRWRLPHDWRQYALRSLAFVAWAMVLGNPLGAWMDGAQVKQIASFLTLGIPVAGYLLLQPDPSLLE